MGKKNAANEMTVEELVRNGLTVSKKFAVSDEEKEEHGMVLGMILQRYPGNRAIREAGLHASVQYFVKEGKGERGTYCMSEGQLEGIDAGNQRLTVDGSRIRFSDIYSISVDGIDPYETEEDWGDERTTDADGWENTGDNWDDDDWNDGFAAKLTPAERRRREEQMEALHNQMRREQARRLEMLRMEEESWEDTQDDEWYADPDPDEYAAKRREAREQAKPKKKREPKSILWLPPEKRHSKGKKGAA